MAQRQSEMTFDHERHTDVMYVDFCNTPEHAKIRVVEVGDQVGFPGQIHARVDMDSGNVYGITIQNFRTFKRRLMLEYRMASIERALRLFMAALCAGLGIGKDHQRQHALHEA